MKKIIIITAVLSLIAGACIAITGYFAYIVIKMDAQVAMNTSSISQIVSYLQQQAEPKK